MKSIFNFFLKKYSKEDEQLIYETKAMVMISISIIVLGIVMFIVLTKSELYAMIGGLMFFCLLFLVLIRLGLKQLTATLMVVVLASLVGAIGFSEEYAHENIVYTMGLLEVFVIVLTLLISSKRSHTIISTLIGEAFLWGYYFVVVRANALNIEVNGMVDMIVNTILIAGAGAVIIGCNYRAGELLASSRRKSLQQKMRARALETLVSGLSEDFNTGDLLVKTSVNMVDTLNEISEDIDHLKNDMKELSQGMDNVGGAGNSIAQSTSILSQESDSQTVLIEQSSAAVTEMSSSIESIYRVAKERQSSIPDLLQSTEKADQAIEESEEAVGQLLHWISSLQEINDVISGISSQTSLLAMNAAIEAAHAGDAGKGFAVVADEVRKLSENSAENVKIIAQTLSRLTQSIDMSSQRNKDVSDSFGVIKQEIEEMAHGMEEIVLGISELSIGTNEVNEGTAMTVASTGEVRQKVLSVDDQIKHIKEELDLQQATTKNISVTVENAMEKIEHVRETSQAIRKIGEKSLENLITLEEKIRTI